MPDDETPPAPDETTPPVETDTTGLKSALEKEREARKTLEKEAKALQKYKADREAAEQAAADQKAKDEGKYQELITTRDAQINELKPQVETLTTERDRYRDALTKHLDSQREDLPKHITALLDKLDPVDQLEWIADNATEMEAKPSPGLPRNPKPANGKAPNEDKARRSQAGLFRNF